MLLLPRPQRQAMFALYDFCREADDIVDHPAAHSDPRQAMERLELLRREVHAIFHGTPQHPVAVRLQQAAGCFALPMTPFLELLDGMAMDLQQNRYDSLDALELYCHRVAVTVGLLSVRIFGLPAGEGENFAHHLGMAFQMTNILRDVAEDARMGRLYLPEQWLQQEGIHGEEVLAGYWSPALQRVAARLAARAGGHYRQAWRVVPREYRRQLFAAWVMAEIYHGYLERLHQVEFNVFAHPVRLSRWQKVAFLWPAWLRRWGVAPDW